MKIGIPRGLGIYEYPILFIKFFEYLGIDVVMSDKSNSNILKEGINNSLSESCLAGKIFMGHVENLVKRKEKENIDYIFIPRLCTFENNQTICVKLFAVYDICKNIFDAKFLTLNIDYEKNNTELSAFLKLGKKLNKTRAQIVYAYIKARKMQRIYDQSKLKKQIENIKKDDGKLKILLVAHPYVAYDEILGKKIIQILKKEGVNIYFANINSLTMENPKVFKWIRNKDSEYINISKSLFWKSSRNILNGLSSNLDYIDGVIYLSVFPCGTDSLVNELAMRKIKDKPSINLVLDEQDADTGINTRLESFLDILNMNKENIKVSG